MLSREDFLQEKAAIQNLAGEAEEFFDYRKLGRSEVY
jgi:hypothetical protein